MESTRYSQIQSHILYVTPLYYLFSVVVPEILCTHPEATAAAVMISPFPVVDQHDLQRLTVEYQRNDEQEWEVVEAKQSEETLTISITGLLSSTQYKVKTVAHYPDRNVPSEPKQFTTLDMCEFI